jgi:hypothetical protein
VIEEFAHSSVLDSKSTANMPPKLLSFYFNGKRKVEVRDEVFHHYIDAVADFARVSIVK